MFQADITELVQGARRAQHAAAVVGGTDFAAVLSTVAQAMPGSSSAATAGQAGEAWSTWRTSWSHDVLDYSLALHHAGADYAASDAHGSVELTQSGAGIGAAPASRGAGHAL